MPAIRPQTFEEFNGQANAVAILKIAVRSALARKKPLGHVLITGAPGLGKTTLATGVLPKELGAGVKDLVCSSIEKPADFLPTLSRMKAGEILFLDEIHALPRQLHENLYSVLEDSRLTVIIGEGSTDAQALTVELPQFTIIGATTREGMLPEPLRDRFKHQVRLELYSEEEMARILCWTADKHQAALDTEAAQLLVPACHGTARHAGRLIEACIDTVYSVALMDAPDAVPFIDAGVINQTLQRLGYSANGLTKPEVKLLERLAHGKGSPVGLNTLAAILDEEPDTVESVYEPWLLLKGLLEKTSSGRKITSSGTQALKATSWNSQKHKLKT